MVKDKIRNKHIKIRNSFSNDYINNISSIISNKVFLLSQYQNAKNIFIYISLEKEINTSYIIKQAKKDNKNIYCPVISDEKHKMVFKKYVSESCLIKNKFNILEPLYEIEKNSDENTIIIVPMLAYNKNNYRIGYGGGYYDYYLKNNIYMSSIGICFEDFMCDFKQNIYDEKLDLIITEKNIH